MDFQMSYLLNIIGGLIIKGSAQEKTLKFGINCSSLKICAVRYFLCIDRDTRKKKNYVCCNKI